MANSNSNNDNNDKKNNTNDKKQVSLIDRYNQNTTNKVARLIANNPQTWQRVIADNPMYSISGERPVIYRGVNAISLAITNLDRENTDNRFITRNVVEKTTGLAIKDGAKALQISYLRNKEVQVKGEKKSIPLMSVGYVYSVNDITGITSIKSLPKEQSQSLPKESSKPLSKEQSKSLLKEHSKSLSKESYKSLLKESSKSLPKESPKELSALSLSQQQLIQKSTIPVVRSNKKSVSEFNAKTNEIQIAASVFDKGGDSLVSNYAMLATKVAVDKNYIKDTQDIKAFKAQMSAALIIQSVGAKFSPQGTIKDVKGEFNTEFLKQAKSGMSVIRSSAKIANFVANGRSFEMIKNKDKTTEKPKAEKRAETKKPQAKKQQVNNKPKTEKQQATNKPTARQRLDKRYANAKEVVKKPTVREKLDKRRANEKEAGRDSR